MNSKIYNRTISLLLAAIGFSAAACSNREEMMDEYGVPSADFRIRGKVVDKQSQEPIEGLRAVMVKGNQAEYDKYKADTVFTDRGGLFDLSVNEWPKESQFLLVIEDVDGENNGRYGNYARTVEFTDDFSGSGWKKDAVEDVGNVELEKIKTEK